MPTCKNGMMPSRAMACSSRGAPVRLWSPAPQQEKNEPITITQGEGQARIPMTGFFFTEKPNLKHTGMRTVYQVCYSTLLWWLNCCVTRKPVLWLSLWITDYCDCMNGLYTHFHSCKAYICKEFLTAKTGEFVENICIVQGQANERIGSNSRCYSSWVIIVAVAKGYGQRLVIGRLLVRFSWSACRKWPWARYWTPKPAWH